jgi:hypothetical protein
MVMTERSLLPLARLADDQKIVAERAWRAPSRARTAQAPCDVGLFSDSAAQTDLLDALNRNRKD